MTIPTPAATKPTLTITVGLPGSGKTTHARKVVAADTTHQTVRINRDDLRKMVFDEFWFEDAKIQEPIISKLQNAAVSAALRNGLNVIVDDTNLRAFAREAWAKLAARCGAELVIVVMNVDVEECQRRNLKRFEETGERLVPSEVISGMAEAFAAESAKA